MPADAPGEEVEVDLAPGVSGPARIVRAKLWKGTASATVEERVRRQVLE